MDGPDISGFGAMSTVALEFEFITVAFNFDHFVRRGKSQTAGDTIFEQLNVRVLEFDDFIAVHANEVVVRWAVYEVGIIDFCVRSEFKLAQQAAFDKQGERPVNGRPGNRLVDVPSSVKQFLGGKMVGRSKRSLNNRFTLVRAAETFGGEKLLKAPAHTL